MEQALAAFRPGTRFLRVEGDHMEPTLCNRDYVAVVPVTGFVRDGLYVVHDAFGTPLVKRCQWFMGDRGAPGYLMMWGDRPGSMREILTREQFQEVVLGIVAAEVRVTNPDMLGEG